MADREHTDKAITGEDEKIGAISSKMKGSALECMRSLRRHGEGTTKISSNFRVQDMNENLSLRVTKSISGAGTNYCYLSSSHPTIPLFLKSHPNASSSINLKISRPPRNFLSLLQSPT